MAPSFWKWESRGLACERSERQFLWLTPCLKFTSAGSFTFMDSYTCMGPILGPCAIPWVFFTTVSHLPGQRVRRGWSASARLWSLCPSICPMPLAQKRRVSGLWLLYNTNRKPHAGSWTHRSAWPCDYRYSGRKGIDLKKFTSSISP